MKIDKEMIISKSTELANKCASELGLEIVSVEYVFENGVKILRIIATSDEGLTIDQASLLNEAISLKLDEEDFIDEEYYLEVSSEGIEKELRNDKDITDAVGKYVNARFYEKVENFKEVEGDLISFIDNNLTIKCNIKGRIKTITVKKEQISKIRLAVKF